MVKITTIWGWNWQSNLLDWFLSKFWDRVEISSIVSMSDDGRTTWALMKSFDEELWLHLPPPWDLRRCLFSLSNSEYKNYFKLVFEYTFLNEEKIKNFTIFELFKQVNKELLFFGKWWELKSELIKFIDFSSGNLHEILIKKCNNIFDFVLPLESSLKWHKFWNILMASLYYNFEKDYDIMLKFMHDLLDVKWEVIPVTTKRAFIRAILWNWNIIESQDRISNVADYNSGIADLELMKCSFDAVQNNEVHDAIINSDFLIVWPGDLFTSIISNFIIWWVQVSICESKAKIIFIWNSTNKWWETTWLTQLDFVNKIERFLWRRIDYFISNNEKPELTEAQMIEFKNDISVKWWDYLFLSKWEKSELIRRKINVIETNLLSSTSFYKHSKEKLLEVIEKIIF
jgi:uncharacterized cofD-like protein